MQLVARDPRQYLEDASWIETIGVPWMTFVEQTPDGGLERRVMFQGGLDVDFAIDAVATIDAILADGAPPELVDLVGRGLRVLVDKDGSVARLQEITPATADAEPPTQAAFWQNANDFWYHTVWTAKHLRRGEIWWAKGGCDGHLKGLLREMMQWHTRASLGPHHDTWFRGRFLEEWADPLRVTDLYTAFAHYDEDDIWRALDATMKLYRWIAAETAEKLGLDDSSSAAAHAETLVTEMRNGRWDTGDAPAQLPAA